MKKVFHLIWLAFLLTGTIGYGQTTQKESKQFKAFKQQILLQLQHKGSYRYFPERQHLVVQNREKNTKVSSGYGNIPSLGWAEQFGGSADDYGMDVAADDDGNAFVGGYFSGKINNGAKSFTSKGDFDGFVARFDPAGQLIWFTQLSTVQGNRINVTSICIDNSNNIYATGYYTGTVIFGSYTLTAHASYNPFLIKLNPTGKIIWAKTFSGVQDDTPEIGKKIKRDLSGNLYIISSQSSNYHSPTLISKFDSTGTMLWKQYHPENFSDMTIAGNGIYFTGLVFPGTGRLDNNVTVKAPTNNYEIFYAKADLNGKFIWGKSLQHSSYGYSQSPHIGIGGGSFLYLTGFIQGKALLDTIQLKGGDNFYCKIDTGNGHVVDAKEFSPGRNIPTGIVVSENNNVYISELSTIVKFDKTSSLIFSKSLNYSSLENIFLNSKGRLWTTGIFNEHIKTALMDSLGNEIWQVEFNGDAASGDVLSIATDNAGYVYTYAYTSNPLDFYGYQLKKGIFLCKQNSKGTIIWLKQFPGNYSINYNYTGKLITIDPDNNCIYITSSINGSFNIPNGPSISETFLLKFDMSGNYIWSYHNNISGNGWNQLDLATDHLGNILWSGVFTGTINIGTQQLISAGSADVFIAKFNNSGQFLWAKRAGGESVEYNGLVATNSDDEIYLTGEFDSQNVTVGNTSITLNEGDGNILLAKFDKFGKVLWVKSKAGSTQQYGDWYCWPTGMETGPSGNIYMKGWHGSSARFDSILLTSPYPYNYFIAKFDTAGNTIWAKSINEHHYGFDYNQFSVDENGNMYIGAQAYDTIKFGKEYTYVSQSTSDQFIAKYSTDGELEWVKPVPGNSTSWSWISAVMASGYNVYVGGYFDNFISFGGKVLKSRNQSHGFSAQLIQPHDHFTPVWSGNPYQPMNILVKSAGIYGVSLKKRDEVGVFVKDSTGNDICVGAAKLTDSITGGNPLPITISADDPTTPEIDGFINGRPIYYKLWKADEQMVLSNVSAVYDTAFDQVFTRLGTALVSLSGYAHYKPVWTGNPYQPMNILIDSVIMPDSSLKAGDEIGVFDKDKNGKTICVGAGVVNGTISSKIPLVVIASADDPGTAKMDGFIKNHQIIFKAWSAAGQKEYAHVMTKYNPAFETKFSPLGTALVSLTFSTNISQSIALTAGWNMMSFNMTPDTLNMLHLLHPLISKNHLLKVIDEKGGFIQDIPGVGWMNTIGDMANTEGYYIKVSSNDTLKAAGTPVNLPFTIPLQSGWNMMGYPLQTGQAAITALDSLIKTSSLIKVINEAGGFIQNIPGVGWMNTIGNFLPGEGYYIKVNSDTHLTLNNSTKEAGITEYAPVALPKPKYFIKAFKGNPYYPMNIVLTDINLGSYSLQPGDEIAVFDKDVCVGTTVIPQHFTLPLNIVASMDDPITQQQDGYFKGDDITIRYRSGKMASAVDMNIDKLSGTRLFSPLETLACSINTTTARIKQLLKTDEGSLTIYPNPARGSFTLLYSNPEKAQLRMDIANLNGKRIKTISDKMMPEGNFRFNYNVSGLPAGIYTIRVVRSTVQKTTIKNYKLVVVK